MVEIVSAVSSQAPTIGLQEWFLLASGYDSGDRPGLMRNLFAGVRALPFVGAEHAGSSVPTTIGSPISLSLVLFPWFVFSLCTSCLHRRIGVWQSGSLSFGLCRWFGKKRPPFAAR